MSRAKLWQSQKRSFRRRLLGGRPGVECHYCGKRITAQDATIDHVVPICRGGALGLHNIVLACRECNARKGSRSYKEFVRGISRRGAAA